MDQVSQIGTSRESEGISLFRSTRPRKGNLSCHLLETMGDLVIMVKVDRAEGDRSLASERRPMAREIDFLLFLGILRVRTVIYLAHCASGRARNRIRFAE